MRMDARGDRTARLRPRWLRTRLPGGEGYARVRRLLDARGLHTVCDEARCPNKAECWGAGTATFLLLGDRCTRNCRFCSVSAAGASLDPPDETEADDVVEAARILDLRHVVLTSVTRDDLPDGGAGHFARVVRTLRGRLPDVTVEALVPPLLGDDLGVVMEAGVDVLAHNLEVVRRLTPAVRDRRADYDVSLEVLRRARALDPSVTTKSSLLLGLGETAAEVREALADMRAAGVDVVALGQYLKPTRRQVDVEKYLTPQRWRELTGEAIEAGFAHVAAGPFVRTSFRAHEALAAPGAVPEIEYETALELQRAAQRTVRETGAETLVVCTHPPVITLGRMADRTHVRASGEELARAGVEVVRTTRGGDVTYHGPGQLVVYPILDLTRRSLGTRRYVRELLGCVQRTLVSFGVDATLHDRRIGVFVDDGHGPPAKVAALGVSVSRGITGHGVAVNVSTDPEDFGLIVPCGSTDTGVTSLHRLLERPPGLGEVADRLVAELRSVFGGRLRVRPSGSAGRSAHDGVLPSPKTR